jgi:hypothetical protein
VRSPQQRPWTATPVARDDLAQAAWTAVGVATVGAVAWALVAGDGVVQAAGAAASPVLWTVVRRPLLVLVADDSRARDVWAASALPMALAWTGPLELVATVASAIVAYRAARAAALPARRMVLLAYGAQLVVLLGAWLLRGPVLALV